MKKRNKSKDNPYTLFYDKTQEIYQVEFVDNLNKLHVIEITEEIYKAFDKFELEDISQIHKFRKHIEHSEIYEETLYKRMMKNSIPLEEEVENKLLMEELKKAIDQLSEVQKKRVKLYYFEDMTVEEIADLEGTTHQAISKSVRKAVEEIKKIMKN